MADEPTPSDADRGNDAQAQADSAGLGEALHALGDQSRQSLRAALASGQALRELLAADLALARAALGRSLVFAGTAAALGAAAWLLLLAAGVAGLRALGLPWAAALLIAAVVGAAGAMMCGLAARRSLAHADLQATRRQLARLFPVPDHAADTTDTDHSPRPGAT